MVLRVVCGGVGLYERDVVLTEEQLADYARLGKYSLDSLALKVSKGMAQDRDRTPFGSG